MKKLFILFAIAAVTASCGIFKETAGHIPTRGERYVKMYEEKPVMLLVMPPMNNTSYVAAKDLLYTSISRPLAERGYYVVSPFMAMDILRAESAYDSEMFVEGPLTKFKDFFGCDAVVFSEIQDWTKRGTGIDVTIRYFIKSAVSGEILFDRTCDLYLDLDLGIDNGSNSLLLSVVNLAASAINTAATDHIVAARKANYFIFDDLPFGKYHPKYMQDTDYRVDEDENIRHVVER